MRGQREHVPGGWWQRVQCNRCRDLMREYDYCTDAQGRLQVAVHFVSV